MKTPDKKPVKKSSVNATLAATRNRSIRVIDDLFGDTTVPAERTLDLLVELRDDIDMKIAAIRSDLARQGK